VVFQAVSAVVSIALSNVAIIYSELTFGWTGVETGYMFSAYGIARVLQLTFLYPGLISGLRRLWHSSTHRLDMIDSTVIRISTVACTLCLCFVAYSPTGLLFGASVVSIGVGAVAGPIARNAIIKYTKKDSVGEVLGALGFVSSSGMIMAPLVFFTIFRYTVNARPHFVFELLTVIYALMLLVTLKLKPVRDPLEDIAEEEALDNVEND
jgi:MFS family permease